MMRTWASHGRLGTDWLWLMASRGRSAAGSPRLPLSRRGAGFTYTSAEELVRDYRLHP